jgi:uncharacterized membrane protein YfcA
MLISSIFIGSVLGFILALTGSGGALLGIPLLMMIGHISLISASVMILPIVALGAFFSWVLQRQHCDYRVMWTVFLWSIPASLVTIGIKPYLGDLGIKILLMIVGLWGAYSTWRPLRNTPSARFSKDSTTPASLTLRLLGSLRPSINRTSGAFLNGLTWTPLMPSKARLVSMGIGVLSGALTTLTGLGGGLFLFPALRQGLGLDTNRAIATSLGVIVGNTLISFGLQMWHGGGFSGSLTFWSGIFMGLILANVMAVVLISKCTMACSVRIRKLTYTVVLCVSMLLLFNL